MTSTKVEMHCALCLSIGCGCGSSPRRERGRRCSLQPCDSISCRSPCSIPSSCWLVVIFRRGGARRLEGWSGRWLDVASIEPLIAFVTTRGSSQPILQRLRHGKSVFLKKASSHRVCSRVYALWHIYFLFFFLITCTSIIISNPNAKQP